MRWYHRRWNLTAAVVTKFIDKWVFSAKLTPGTRRVAYFKYIRAVRPGNPEAGKKVWVPGMPTINVGAYFPGSITTACQPTTLIVAEQVRFSDLAPSRPAVFSVLVTASSIMEAAAAAKGLRTGFRPHPLLEFEWLREQRKSTVAKLLRVSLRLRHRRFPALTLWMLRDIDVDWLLPHHFSVAVTVPPPSPLTELLAFAEWELNVTTTTDNGATVRDTNVVLEDARFVAT